MYKKTIKRDINSLFNYCETCSLNKNNKIHSTKVTF